MTIELVVNGEQFTNFTEIELVKSLDTVSGEFTFSAVAAGEALIKDDFPFKTGQTCQVIVDGVTQLNGFIEIINVSYDTTQHIISISGRDKTADIIDSQLGNNVEFIPEGDMTLIQLIELSLIAGSIKVAKSDSEEGIQIIVADGVTIRDFIKSEVEAGALGDSLYSFIEGLCRKRQIILTSNANGDLLLVRASRDELSFDLGLFNIIGGTANNIKSAEMTLNDSEKFNKYIAHSALNTSGRPRRTSFKSLSNPFGEFIDGSVRPGRVLNFYTEKSSDSDECARRAGWEANLRNVRAFSYQVTVANHSIPSLGLNWQLNRLVQVIDEFADIDEKLLINGLTWNFSNENGSTTVLDLVRPDAYDELPNTIIDFGIAGELQVVA